MSKTITKEMLNKAHSEFNEAKNRFETLSDKFAAQECPFKVGQDVLYKHPLDNCLKLKIIDIKMYRFFQWQCICKVYKKNGEIGVRCTTIYPGLSKYVKVLNN